MTPRQEMGEETGELAHSSVRVRHQARAFPTAAPGPSRPLHRGCSNAITGRGRERNQKTVWTRGSRAALSVRRDEPWPPRAPRSASKVPSTAKWGRVQMRSRNFSPLSPCPPLSFSLCLSFVRRLLQRLSTDRWPRITGIFGCQGFSPSPPS